MLCGSSFAWLLLAKGSSKNLTSVFKMSDSRVLFNGNFPLEILAINCKSLQLTRSLPDCFYKSITYSRELWRMLRISFLVGCFIFFFFFDCLF